MEDTSRDDWAVEDYRREMQRVAGEIEKHDRASIARDLCKWANDQIAQEAPVGLSAWGRTWLLVSEAGADFLGVLTRWEASGGDTDLAELHERCIQLLDAWNRAGNKFEEHLG